MPEATAGAEGDEEAVGRGSSVNAVYTIAHRRWDMPSMCSPS
ncbi:hypothetical protein [Leadbettera azotonutricia]|nr:hypothetical protein [Leadbettera azotonutricia]